MRVEMSAAAEQHVIRRAGFHVGTMPLVDMRNGGSRYVVDARDAETGESWSVIADSEYEATVRLAEQVGIEIAD